MATFGTVDLDCPVCGRPLRIPITALGPIGTPSAGLATLHVEISPDHGYIRAHWLTHGPHDGEPLPIAA